MKSQAGIKGLSRRVFVGMSGGVDSSVSAALLKQAGYDVTGVFIRVWQPDWIECNWREDRRDAMRVCAALDIPFITLDLEKEYKRDVIDFMIAEYKAGRTPNPDVMCNKYVKFGGFLDFALKNGADFIATGHYARNIDDRLIVSKDSNKDQTYFLWTLNQKQLSHVLFPVGHLEKPEVRKLAKKFKLPVADKKDSQGLCFIGKVDFKEFLATFTKLERGNVLNERKEVIGFHDGAQLFTIGERHGFTITKKTPDDAPYFIVSKDVKANTITVSSKDPDGDLQSAVKEVALGSVNWISGKAPDLTKKYMARARYRAPLKEIRLKSLLSQNVTANIRRDQVPWLYRSYFGNHAGGGNFGILFSDYIGCVFIFGCRRSARITNPSWAQCHIVPRFCHFNGRQRLFSERKSDHQ